MSNGCRYHAIGDSIYFQGILRVKCSGGKECVFKDLSEDYKMAKTLCEKLNYDLETLERFEPKKGVKHG